MERSKLWPKLRVAVASGLGNARKLIEAIRVGTAEYDFVEIRPVL
jgi:NADH-quinone oxidoreductase subunit G